MPADHSKLERHAETRLPSPADRKPLELLDHYRRFVKLEQNRLKRWHYAGESGLDLCRKRAELVDFVLEKLFSNAWTTCHQAKDETPATGFALLAVGGYGRGELNPFSDIDMVFLLEGRKAEPTAVVGEVIEQILYSLWDIGFKVGHSTRTIPSALAHANEDLFSKTAFMESRLIAGDRALFREFRRQFDLECVAKHQDEFIQWRLEDQRARHAKYGRTVFLQEPNIKNGCGGLRDYQNLLWITFIREGRLSLDALVEKQLIDPDERRELDRAYDFLLRVRTELHYLNGRSTDILTLNFQGQAANRFRYPQKNVLRRSEAFMRDYYRHARSLFLLTRRVMKRLSIETGEESGPSGVLALWLRRRGKESFDGFQSRDGFVYARDSSVFDEDPLRMMRLFQHLQQRHLRLSPELEHLLHQKLRLVDREFQYNRAAWQTFEAILSRKGEVGPIIRTMHQVGFLGRYLPEFKPLTCLVQHEFFHRYTADEHTLVCIELLDGLIDTHEQRNQFFSTLFQQLHDPVVLYLALLLHDTGKAGNYHHHAEGSALNAQQVSRRLQLSPERRRKLIFLVDHHTTLSFIAASRNLDDIATIKEFASMVGSVENLEALLLLTFADIRGTSEESWTDWKESLVLHLFHAARDYLSDKERFYAEHRVAREEARRAVAEMLPPDYEDEVRAHFEFMPDRYFLTATREEMAEHLKLFRRFLENRFSRPDASLTPALHWEAHPDQNHSKLVVCAWDRHDLLARMAGCLSAYQINILSADIFTRADNLVLDIFRVCTPRFEPVTSPRLIQQVEALLKEAVAAEDFEFDTLLKKARQQMRSQGPEGLDFPTRIVIANDSTPHHTLVEVMTPDRLGLLYDLLRVFSQLRLHISSSRISTEKGGAIDTFYVTDEEGRKVEDPDRIREIQEVLQRAAVKDASHMAS